LVGITALEEIGLAGEESFLGFFASLVDRCSLDMGAFRWGVRRDDAGRSG